MNTKFKNFFVIVFAITSLLFSLYFISYLKKDYHEIIQELLKEFSKSQKQTQEELKQNDKELENNINKIEFLGKDQRYFAIIVGISDYEHLNDKTELIDLKIGRAHV